MEICIYTCIHIHFTYTYIYNNISGMKKQNLSKITRNSLLFRSFINVKGFLRNESLLKMMKNGFYIMLKDFFVLEIFKFLS